MLEAPLTRFAGNQHCRPALPSALPPPPLRPPPTHSLGHRSFLRSVVSPTLAPRRISLISFNFDEIQIRIHPRPRRPSSTSRHALTHSSTLPRVRNALLPPAFAATTRFLFDETQPHHLDWKITRRPLDDSLLLRFVPFLPGFLLLLVPFRRSSFHGSQQQLLRLFHSLSIGLAIDCVRSRHVELSRRNSRFWQRECIFDEIQWISSFESDDRAERLGRIRLGYGAEEEHDSVARSDDEGIC